MGRWSDSNLIKSRVIPIGVWDMDTTSSVTVSMGDNIPLNSIIHITVMINNDAEDTRYDPSLVGSSWTETKADSTDITLTRSGSGFFDSTDFDDAVIDRGDVTVWYTT